MALTDTKVRAAKPDEKAYTLADSDGLFLYVHPNGSKYWRFRFRFGGKQHLMAFGVYPEISLADARERRDAARKQVALGIDPRELKKELKEEQQRNLTPLRKLLVIGTRPIKSGQKGIAIEFSKVLRTISLLLLVNVILLN